jgi:predicted ATP-grasp superfamily ATP-dependent carboligase
MIGIAVIADQGRIAFAYQHRCLHAVPITGGSWSYRVTEPVDSLGLQHVAKMVSTLRWTGVAEFEFKEDPTSGALLLLEVNGRFWFSLPLAVAAGADFPAYLYDLLAHGQREFPRQYRVGVRGRNLGRDLVWTRDALRRDATLAGVVSFPSYRSVVGDWLRAFDPRERFDTLSLRDPLPTVCDLVQIAQRILFN